MPPTAHDGPRSGIQPDRIEQTQETTNPLGQSYLDVASDASEMSWPSRSFGAAARTTPSDAPVPSKR